MSWYIVPYTLDYAVLVEEVWMTSRTLAINTRLRKVIGVNPYDFEGIEVRGNRAIVRVKAETIKEAELDGQYYRLPLDELGGKLDKVDLQGLNEQLLSMGYTQKEIGTAFPDGLSAITLKDFINFAQSQLYEMAYDAKQGQLIETGTLRGQEFKPKDPTELDDRIGKTSKGAVVIDAGSADVGSL